MGWKNLKAMGLRDDTYMCSCIYMYTRWIHTGTPL